MNKKKFKDLSLALRIAVFAVITAFVINILTFLFVLLPIYGIVGDNSLTSTEKDNKLENSETITEVVMVSTVVLITVSVVSGGYGVYNDVRSKSKK